jgi:hypothetical protein
MLPRLHGLAWAIHRWRACPQLFAGDFEIVRVSYCLIFFTHFQAYKLHGGSRQQLDEQIRHTTHPRLSQNLPDGLTLGNEFEILGFELRYLLICEA